MNIYVTRPIPEIGLKMLRDKGYTVDVGCEDCPPSKKQIIKMLKKKPYDAVLSLLTDQIDAEVLDQAGPQLKVVSNYAVGHDNIDLEATASRNIVATNTAGTSSECVAEHTIALMFAISRNIVVADRYVRNGKYKGWDPMLFIGDEIRGKTLGLIGAGAIGSQVAHKAVKGLDMKVLYYDVKRNEAIEQDCGAVFKATPEEVLKEADVISVHVPLLPSTREYINKERLQLMKPTAYLINTSRGPVVCEESLVWALQNKIIKGAAIDVYEDEPKLARGLAKLDNVILTPHIASATHTARNQMSVAAAQNIIDVFEGRAPKGLLNV
jgi:glyoxylate reductase